MNESITYHWSEDLAYQAIAAHNRLSVGRLSFLVVSGGLFFCAGFIVSIYDQTTLGVIASVTGLLMCLVALKSRLNMKRLAHDSARLIRDPLVTVIISNESMSWASDCGNRTIHWSQLTRVTESGGFLMLFAGRLLAAILPADAFSDEQIRFIKSQVGARTGLPE